MSTQGNTLSPLLIIKDVSTITTVIHG